MSERPLLCPMCLSVTPAAVPLPCGHAFCLPCLQNMDRGLDRHCCPQCRREYHPHYCYYYCDCDTGDCEHRGGGATGESTHGNGKRAATEAAFQNKAQSSTSSGAEAIAETTFNPLETGNCFFQGTGGFQNKTQFLKENEARQESSENGRFQNKMQSLSTDLGEDDHKRYKFVEVNDQDATGNGECQSKSSVSVDSELYDYLKSKIVHAPNIAEKMTTSQFQNKTSLLETEAQKSGQEIKTVKDNVSFAFQNKTPNMGEDEIPDKSRQNKTPTSEDSLVSQNKSQFLKAESGHDIKTVDGSPRCDFQNKKSQENKTPIREGTGKVDSGSEPSLVFQNKSPFPSPSGQDIKTGEDIVSFAFQNKTPIMGEDKILNKNQQNKTPTSEDTRKGDSGSETSLEFQTKALLLKAECGQEIKSVDDSVSFVFQNKNSQENKTPIREGTGQVDSGSEPSLVFQNKIPVSEEDQRKMSEAKSRLTSRVSDLTSQLEKAESSLDKERRHELKVTAANAELRQNARTLAGDVASFARAFSERVLELMEQELGPGEAELRGRVAHAEETADGIRKAIKDAESLLREEDWRVFTAELGNVEREMERRGEVKPRDDGEVTFDLAKLCPELERLQAELREKLGQVQRSLRSAFNPSELTFDPETLHPNLVLSEDMKTVRFSAKKQQYSPSPLRFSTFFQVLSAQSFSSGVHRWEVELEGAPWILGVCAASALPRAGLPSALETCPSSWALMWSNNLLTAFTRSRATSLKKTSEASRRLRLELDLEQRALTFHHRGLSGDSLIHRFSLDTDEPLHLGYRMLSGDARGRVSITS